MPFLGIGLHVLVALYFAVHAIRSGQQIYWLLILFSFPLLGSIVYFFAIYMPNSKLEFGAKKVVAVAAKTLDPTRELREARNAFEYTPTAQNQMRLAFALLEAGNAEEAATNYEACLKGPFASDLEIKYCAARALIESGRHATAISHLEEVHSKDSNFRPAQISLLLAQALAGAGRNADATVEFESAMQRFGSFEIQAEYAIWAYSNGDKTTAQKLQANLDQTMKRWNRHTRDIHQSLVRRLNAAKTNSNT